MKYIILLFVLYATSVCGQINLVTYDLTVDGAGVNAQYVKSSEFKSVNTNIINYGSKGAYASGWATGSVFTDYYEITVKPELGYKLTISELDFGERRSSTGIREYEVRISTDGFNSYTVLANVNVPDDDNERVGDITGLNITVDDGDSAQIRWYGYLAEKTNGTWRINDGTLKVKGTVVTTNVNDMDSKVTNPSSQIGNTLVSSVNQTEASAIDVFKFTITDLGTTDGKPTSVRKIKIKKHSGSQLLDDWIKGFRLKDGATLIPISSVVAASNSAFFELYFDTGDLVIADNTSKELTLGVYLKSDVEDNKSFSFYIDADDNGFLADISGSGFSNDFGVDIISSTITITVEATKLIYQVEPSSTEINSNIFPSPQIAFVDATNNIDVDISGSANNVTLSTTGTFAAASINTITPVNGVAAFASIIHSALGTGIVLSASTLNNSITSASSLSFNILAEATVPVVDSLYISEVSDASNYQSEFLEIYNASNQPIDIKDLVLNRINSSGSVTNFSLSSFIGDHIVDSMSYLVISRGASRSEFENDWPSFPPEVGFLQGNSALYFGGKTKYRWQITYDDGAKAVNIIDDSQQLVGGKGNSSNQLTKGNWTDYDFSSNATPGSSNENSELPISLLSFQAELKNDLVYINWQTATESNNDYFTIERSLDAEHFEAIGKVHGAGNSNIVKSYSYVDDYSSNNSIVYYRLKQTDYDGSFTYSKIISVNINTDKLSVLNTCQKAGNLNINISSPEYATMNMEVYNLNGQLLINKSAELQKGQNTIQLDISTLPQAIYLIRFISDGFIQTQKVLIR